MADLCPVRWTGRQAEVLLPEHIDASVSGQVHEQLLGLVNGGATVLIADMTETVSCDHSGADALVGAHRRASVHGSQLRLVVTAQVIRRVLEARGLDRLISIYPTAEAAAAAGQPGGVIPLEPWPARPRGDGLPAPPVQQWPAVPGAAVLTPAVLWKLVDALADGVVLTDDSGVVVLANRRAEEIFGYGHAELAGRPVEVLLPAHLQQAHIRYRAGYARQLQARPMGAGARLVGLRKDGATFPVEISLSPVPTATGHFTLAVIRNRAETQPREDLASLARATAAAAHGPHGQDLLDEVVGHLSEVGLSLQAAGHLPHDIAGERITGDLQRLDDTIREIRDQAFADPRQADPAPGTPAE